MAKREDKRSPEADQYRKLYATARWQRIRAKQLNDHPVCQRCLQRGYVAVATICHHVDRHSKRTDFFAGPWLSVCQPCHDGPIQQEEAIGYTNEIGLDGWPTHPSHPANRKR